METFWAETGFAAFKALILYAAGIVIVRLARERMLGRGTIMDFLVVLVLGSLISRAINGAAKVPPTLAAGVMLIVLHRFAEAALRRWHFLEPVLEGRILPVYQDGQMLPQNMRATDVSKKDLLESARANGHMDLKEVQAAFIERNGRISVIPQKSVNVLEIKVENGVQIVRVEIQL